MAVLFANDTIGPSAAYEKQLKAEHHGSKWGSTGARYSGTRILNLLRERPQIESVLDFGAGKQTLGRFVQDNLGRDIEWRDYDPGVPDIADLPDRRFDCVVSTDVLEHVEPERLTDTLRTLASLTGQVLVSDIACYPTGKLFGEGPYIGEDLHLIVEEPEWWRNQFLTTGLHLAYFEGSQKFSKGIYKERCFMIHERV